MSAIIKCGKTEGIDVRLLESVERINDIMSAAERNASIKEWCK
jgi:hypothetical protein